MSGNIRVRGSITRARNTGARHHICAATETRGSIHERGTTDERQHTSARKHICGATQLRGSIHERGPIANIDVNEAATNETIRVAAIHKKIIYVCNGWHGRYNCVYICNYPIYK